MALGARVQLDFYLKGAVTGGVPPKVAGSVLGFADEMVAEQRDQFLRLFAAHQPEIDFGYEEVNCSCGWLAPDSRGRRTIRDGSRDWPGHFRRVLKRQAGGFTVG